MDPRVIRAFTPVFDELCPRVTSGYAQPLILKGPVIAGLLALRRRY
jgi:hypothetical protein